MMTMAGVSTPARRLNPEDAAAHITVRSFLKNEHIAWVVVPAVT
jgi:hypothetical protein